MMQTNIVGTAENIGLFTQRGIINLINKKSVIVLNTTKSLTGMLVAIVGERV